MGRFLRLWSFAGRIGRAEYIASGVALFVVKYSIDLLIATRFGRAWNPLMYLSPRISPLTTTDPREAYWLWLLVAALPFIAAGIALSVRRLRDMGYSPFWAGLFLFPFLHFLFFLVLAAAPPCRREAEAAPGGPSPRHAAPALVFGLAASLLIGWLAYVVGERRNALGPGMFIGAPFAMGFITSYAMNFWHPRTKWASVGYGLLTLLSSYVVLFALGW